MTPRVSVVIPTYNSAWCVGRTIRSVLHQTMPDHEVIVVNDGSTDDFDAAISPFKDEPRLRVIDQPNAGLAGARNRGVQEARAPLVAPLDADDLWHPEFLASALRALDGDPSAPFAYAYHFRMDEDDFLFPYLVPRRPPRHDFVGLLSLNSVSCGSAGVYRREPVLRAGGFDEDMAKRGLEGAEDWKLILRLARLGTPALVERPLVGYRFVADSMSQGNPRQQFGAVMAVIEEMRRDAPDIPSRVFADARTMMTAWLLPAFARRRDYRTFVREGVRAYARNPFWFTNPLLRRAHLNRLKLAGRALRDLVQRRDEPLLHLSDATFDGRRVFRWLEKVAPAPRSARQGPMRRRIARLVRT